MWTTTYTATIQIVQPRIVAVYKCKPFRYWNIYFNINISGVVYSLKRYNRIKDYYYFFFFFIYLFF